MNLQLLEYENKIHAAISKFWMLREYAKRKQIESAVPDMGERACVTSAKHMDAFIELISDIICDNGIEKIHIHQKRTTLTLPGFFRPTKRWDLLVTYHDELIAVIELKSQVGPSFGNNFNNRAEEAIGSALDLWCAYREGAYGEQPRPFVGWFILVEDSHKSRSPVSEQSPYFDLFEEFKNTSYLQRYDLLCKKLIKEHLYTAATLITSPKSAIQNGEYSCLSDMTNIKTFFATLAGHIAASVARLNT